MPESHHQQRRIRRRSEPFTTRGADELANGRRRQPIDGMKRRMTTRPRTTVGSSSPLTRLPILLLLTIVLFGPNDVPFGSRTKNQALLLVQANENVINNNNAAAAVAAVAQEEPAKNNPNDPEEEETDPENQDDDDDDDNDKNEQEDQPQGMLDGVWNMFGGQQQQQENGRYQTYSVCNGAVDQLLYHAAAIAAIHFNVFHDDDDEASNHSGAVANNNSSSGTATTNDSGNSNNLLRRRRRKHGWVQIPNVFIYNTEPDATTTPNNRITPTANNSVALQHVLDHDRVIRTLRSQLGIRARLGPAPPAVQNGAPPPAEAVAAYWKSLPAACEPSLDTLLDRVSNQHGTAREMSGTALILHVLKLLRPGGIADEWVDFLLHELPDGHHKYGMCLHVPTDLIHAQGSATSSAASFLGKSSTFTQDAKVVKEQSTARKEKRLRWQLQKGLDETAATAKDDEKEDQQQDNALLMLQSLKYRGSLTAHGRFVYYVGDNGGPSNGDATPPSLTDHDLIHHNPLHFVPQPLRKALDEWQAMEFISSEGVADVKIPVVLAHGPLWNSTRRTKPQHLIRDEQESGAEAPKEKSLLEQAGKAILGDSESDELPGKVFKTASGLTKYYNHHNNAFWQWIDFFVCLEMKNFVGDGRYDFGALQIALRLMQKQDKKMKRSHDASSADSGTEPVYWYNSKNIPFGPQHKWKGLFGGTVTSTIPIVYTYTEEDAHSVTNKLQFMTSILSVRKHMPHVAIHVLYHVNEGVTGEDEEFGKKKEKKPRDEKKAPEGAQQDGSLLLFLHEQGVEIHDHDPLWERKIKTHGDYNPTLFGTWQRIDIPLFMETEYCLYLDRATLLQQPLDLMETMELTRGMAMSALVNPEDDQSPLDSGVILFNIPYMRQTYRPFLKSVMDSAKKDSQSLTRGPASAYLRYYATRVTFLPKRYSSKPFWPRSMTYTDNADILQFHGPKPMNYIGNILMGHDETLACGPITNSVPIENQFLCTQGIDDASSNGMCSSLALFTKYLGNIGGSAGGTGLSHHSSSSSKSSAKALYCKESFKNTVAEQEFCEELLSNVLIPRHKKGWHNTTDPCQGSFSKVVERSLRSLPLKLQKELQSVEIAKRFGFWKDPKKQVEKPAEASIPPGALLMASLSTTVVGGAVLSLLYVRYVTASNRGRSRGGNNTNRQNAKRVLIMATVAWVVVCFVLLPMVWASQLQ